MPAAQGKRRIYFLDMMKALAVLMMVEGHTVDAFLDSACRRPDSPVYAVWLGIRGFTAPIFMFSSGAVFTYLLRAGQIPFFENPRVKKGFIRFLTLVAIGYLLRYPGRHIVDFSTVTPNQWRVFFTVDALHLIGFGLLFILIFDLVAETARLKDWLVFLCGALFFFGMFTVTEPVAWKDRLPAFLAAYLYHGTGSYFPFFPWAGYVLSGAVLGSWLARRPDAFTSPGFSGRLSGVGVLVLGVSILLARFGGAVFGWDAAWVGQIGVVARRVGVVLMLNGAMSFLAQRLRGIPQIVKQVGRHTLVIYVVHLVIVYGCALFPGMNRVFRNRLDAPEAALAAVVMVTLMVSMVVAIEKVKRALRSRRD
jgi:uncharacterized membrane protein